MLTDDEGNQIHNTIETDIMLNAKHPFIVDMHYLFMSNRNLYMVMPLIKGCDLYPFFRENGPFDENSVRFLSAQIVMALGHLHNRGYIHRDLKLENIMVQENGYVKLIDFGLSKFLKRDIYTWTKAGTANYMAPELFDADNNHKHDKNVDWWSLGCLMYELVVGLTPFEVNLDNTQFIYERVKGNQQMNARIQMED